MMETQFVDYHCHLDLFPNHKDLLAECQKNGIATLTVTTTPKAWQKNVEMASSYDQIRVALGLHPQLVSQRANELVLFEELLQSSRFVGEIGLDASKKFYHSFIKQQQVFQSILQMCAQYKNKIISVHSAYSSKKVLDALETYFFPNNGKVILHWFSGNKYDIQRAVEMGCYFSINQEMIKNKNIQKNLSYIPLEKILSETDGPFVEYESNVIRPINVRELLISLGTLMNIDAQVLKKQIVKNLASLENESKSS